MTGMHASLNILPELYLLGNSPILKTFGGPAPQTIWGVYMEFPNAIDALMSLPFLSGNALHTAHIPLTPTHPGAIASESKS